MENQLSDVLLGIFTMKKKISIIDGLEGFQSALLQEEPGIVEAVDRI